MVPFVHSCTSCSCCSCGWNTEDQGVPLATSIDLVAVSSWYRQRLNTHCAAPAWPHVMCAAGDAGSCGPAGLPPGSQREEPAHRVAVRQAIEREAGLSGWSSEPLPLTTVFTSHRKSTSTTAVVRKVHMIARTVQGRLPPCHHSLDRNGRPHHRSRRPAPRDLLHLLLLLLPPPRRARRRIGARPVKICSRADRRRNV